MSLCLSDAASSWPLQCFCGSHRDVTGRAEPLLWPPGASAVNHTSFRLIYICFENNDDPEIEGRKARLPWCPGLGSISKDTNTSVLRTPPAPGCPAVCNFLGASAWAPLARIRMPWCSAPHPAPGRPAVCSRVGLLHPGMRSCHLRHHALCRLLFRVKRDRGLWVCLRHLLTLRKMLARVSVRTCL